MGNTNQKVFKIQITKNYTFKCFYIDSEKKETPIQIKENQEEYVPSISFQNHSVTFCDEENRTNLIKELYEHPEEYKEYQILFQDKSYSLIFEVLFGLIIEQFKKKVEKDFVIKKTIIEIETPNSIVLERIQVSLQAIGFNDIEIKKRTTEYEYHEQGQLLHILLVRIKEYQIYQRMIEKAKKCNRITEERKDQLTKVQKNISNDETFTRELSKIMTTKERSELELYRLDNYCLFISSRYFESLDDHINFTKVSTRLKRNMEKFHYNPVSLNIKTLSLFPNIQTLHTYKKEDEYLEGGRIVQYVIWNRISYKNSMIWKENMGDEKKIEFKRLSWTQKDSLQEKKKQNPEDVWGIKIEINIPEGVKEIDEDCFYGCNKLKQLTIPTTVTLIPKKCLQDCSQLTNITLPLNENQHIIGNKIFKNNQHFDGKEDIILPTSIQVINDQQVDSNIMIMPTTVTSLDENCFDNCYYLQQLTIPMTITLVPKDCLNNCYELTNITLPLNENQFICCDKVFCGPHFDGKQDIILPTSIQII
ncbi:leucine-rich repeat domain-containing protein, partial [bacterium]|nr:leucine-rich repeat domain-containing protein [bacterium]